MKRNESSALLKYELDVRNLDHVFQSLSDQDSKKMNLRVYKNPSPKRNVVVTSKDLKEPRKKKEGIVKGIVAKNPHSTSSQTMANKKGASPAT